MRDTLRLEAAQASVIQKIYWRIFPAADDYHAFVLADSLVARLDLMEWTPHLAAGIIRCRDLLDEMDRNT